ncbi:hypothetical protein GCM10022393_41230 [Aquimarina addita]|uniref:TolC family protein n=1 Tax=Aquimarina addita TaxID=870485 RepID=A0ABP6UVI0_9FLAO
MKLKIFFFTTVWLYALTLSGQSTITCDLIELSNLTIGKNPTVKRNELQIQIAQAGLQIQRSAFDYQLSSGLGISNSTSNLFEVDPVNSLFEDDFIETNNSDFSLGLQRKFRSGLSANVSVDYSQVSDNFPINRFSQNVGTFISDHTISSTLLLTQPLIKGRGVKVTTAAEKSSSLQVESAENSFELSSALELFKMGVAYWQYAGAYKNHIIFKENENRVKKVLFITKELVKADKKPVGDLVQIEADLANQERQTKVATQSLHNAKINLGRAIGLSEKESEALGIPENEFPITSEHIEAIDSEALINTARKNRKDMHAFEKTQEALEFQLQLASNNLKPQLDLSGFASYGGTNMGNGLDRAFSALGNREGRNYIFGLRLDFSFPINNNFAKGTFLQNKAAFADQQIAYNDLQRNIDINVNIAINNLKNNALILAKAKETLGYYQDVFNNEQTKFQNGLTTLLNLILFQERLTFAQLDYLQAQQRFAISIIDLRYETGTLISMEGNKMASPITEEIYYTIPTPNY